ncbi:hypothetical protein PBCVCan184_873R [Paramecium bursaria Chlorella virus Can18-4]|nr:hypothetical protein PBCVCan184_873R [Paramecium bursaria Chlorella virus Can18-4]
MNDSLKGGTYLETQIGFDALGTGLHWAVDILL